MPQLQSTSRPVLQCFHVPLCCAQPPNVFFQVQVCYVPIHVVPDVFVESATKLHFFTLGDKGAYFHGHTQAQRHMFQSSCLHPGTHTLPASMTGAFVQVHPSALMLSNALMLCQTSNLRGFGAQP